MRAFYVDEIEGRLDAKCYLWCSNKGIAPNRWMETTTTSRLVESMVKMNIKFAFFQDALPHAVHSYVYHIAFCFFEKLSRDPLTIKFVRDLELTFIKEAR